MFHAELLCVCDLHIQITHTHTHTQSSNAPLFVSLVSLPHHKFNGDHVDIVICRILNGRRVGHLQWHDVHTIS